MKILHIDEFHRVHHIGIDGIDSAMDVRFYFRILGLTTLLQESYDILGKLTHDGYDAYRTVLMSQALPPDRHDEQHLRS